MFQALCKRRNIRIKYERFAHGMTASAVYNTNRSKDDDPLIHAFDFVRDDDQARARQELLEIKAVIQRSIKAVPSMAPRSKVLEVRKNLIANLQKAGRPDAEQIFNSMWPHLKPKEDEL